ncbi:hypothetical protein B0A48_17800 [Cryoendolithus antarcticus]|uniref:Uncharacterized protein n=1 Tax=Cryoendolithus antarcticus TaxID=1507870 RepID=A0A1V8SAK0_9PEZI|nr:hypothetical protein B0A48_17800 [Cryoendolithus antarcticus]
MSDPASIIDQGGRRDPRGTFKSAKEYDATTVWEKFEASSDLDLLMRAFNCELTKEELHDKDCCAKVPLMHKAFFYVTHTPYSLTQKAWELRWTFYHVMGSLPSYKETVEKSLGPGRHPHAEGHRGAVWQETDPYTWGSDLPMKADVKK